MFLTLFSLLFTAGLLTAAPERHPVYEPDGKAFPAAAANPADQGIRLLAVSARQRFCRDSLTGLPKCEAAPAVTLRGWRGERVNAQFLVESPKGFDELQVEPCFLTDADGHRVPVQVDAVRYTLSDGFLVGDILDGTSQTSFKGRVRPLWVTVNIPAEAGKPLTGTLKVSVNGQRLSASLTVIPGTMVLPPPADWACHIDIWQHPDPVARWHDVPVWSPEHLRLLEPSMRRLAEIGQKTITATLIDEAWDGQTYDRFRSMIDVTRKADGTYAYDYSKFDTWVSFMTDTVGMKNARIHCYTMVPWSLRFRYFDEAQNKSIAPRMQPGSKAYEAFWGPMLQDFVKHLRAKGWLERTRIAMDERPDNLLRPALAIVKTYAPELKMVAACDRPSAVNEAFDDVSYSYNISEQLHAVADKRTAEGKKTTFYVCCNPVRPNTFMKSDLAESEWLLPLVSRCGLSGFLRWAYHSWVKNPLQCNDFVTWPSGDTSLVYPGDRSSLRLETLRNGIETFEKIRLLRERAAALKRPAALEPLNAALNAFTVGRGGQQGVHEADLKALDEALLKSAELLK